MGLALSHGAGSFAYSYFYKWRACLAQVAGLPPLEFMEGFYSPSRSSWAALMDAETLRSLPILWKSLRPDPLFALLKHSDCDGSLSVVKLIPLRRRLMAMLPLIADEYMHETTKRFIEGCAAAIEAGEPLEFY